MLYVFQFTFTSTKLLTLPVFHVTFTLTKLLTLPVFHVTFTLTKLLTLSVFHVTFTLTKLFTLLVYHIAFHLNVFVFTCITGNRHTDIIKSPNLWHFNCLTKAFYRHLNWHRITTRTMNRNMKYSNSVNKKTILNVVFQNGNWQFTFISLFIIDYWHCLTSSMQWYLLCIRQTGELKHVCK